METEQRKKAAFLDRDGTLIEEVNFLSDVDDLRVFPFTFEAVKLLKDAGFLVIVVTNQSGIGRGIYDEAAMHAIHDEIQARLDGMIDAFYFCPHLPCDGCACRKPNLGMLESAVKDLSVELSDSWMIGDKKIDVETGQNAGTRTALVMTGYGRSHADQLTTKPDVLAENLLDAVRAALL
ncbi:MAG TPA: HAD family hydrolase [Pyrinomonadaceae bacterium]|nr:HAD family hydrolase [Pyrinomonadaceae bacterium]